MITPQRGTWPAGQRGPHQASSTTTGRATEPCTRRKNLCSPPTRFHSPPNPKTSTQAQQMPSKQTTGNTCAVPPHLMVAPGFLQHSPAPQQHSRALEPSPAHRSAHTLPGPPQSTRAHTAHTAHTSHNAHEAHTADTARIEHTAQMHHPAMSGVGAHSRACKHCTHSHTQDMCQR